MASSQVEFASSTSPFGCINRQRVAQGKTLFNHFVRDHPNNNNSHSLDRDNNKANNNSYGALCFAASNEREEQDELLSVSPNHEESSSSSWLSPSPPLRKQKPSPISVDPSDFSTCEDNASNLGASSLVQIWEKRLTQSSSSSSNTTAKSSLTPKSSPKASSSSSPTQSSSSEADSPQGQILHNNEGDHRHHHESERSVMRVADIIRRLTGTSDEEIVDNNNHHHHQAQAAQDHLQNYCVGSQDQQALENNRSFVIRSPRIRGRQAFNDLLMQMERDRHGELNNLADRAAVSKFPYRGRIQSLLRLRLMQRSRSPSTTSQVTTKLPQGSLIMRLRERFGTGIKNNGTASPIEEAVLVEHETPCREKENKVSSPIIYNNPPKPTQSSASHNNKEKDEKAPPGSDVSVLAISEEPNVQTSSSMADVNAESSEVLENNVEGKEEEHSDDVYDEMEEEYEEEYGEIMYDEIVERSEAKYDWISQISKPKSFWEDLRQAWYKEMLDNNESQNKDDIRRLLQRRTVSNFLCSDFREEMDRLMESHKGTQTNLLAATTTSKDNDDDEANNQHGKIGQRLIAFLHQHRMKNNNNNNNNNNPAKRDNQDEKDIKPEEEEEEILISVSYNGESDSMNQGSSSPSQWRYGDDYASLTQPSQSPTSNPPSMEMELIYDLRGHMKQLYREMSELRKSIRSCIDMQIILQKYLNRHNHHTVKGKKSHDRALKKRNCCVCSKMKADSLLYRCGHMCTCLKCANELRWKNGMCPICEAPIVDVVRVHVDA